MPSKSPWQYLSPWIVALLLAVCTTHACARTPSPADPVFNGDAAYMLSQEAVGRTLADYHFTAADGRKLSLGDLRGRPVVLSLVYTSCYQICSTTTRTLARAVRAGRSVLGQDSFVVLTIGFDTPVDTPEAMAAFAISQGVRDSDSDWYFLSGDAATLDALAHDVGFSYQRSAKGFDHLLQTTILDADGRVYSQVYGELLFTPWLVEPLKQLVFGVAPGDGMLAQVANRVRMYCVTYDPATGGYRYDYSLYLGMAIGGLIILSVMGFLLHEMRHPRRI